MSDYGIWKMFEKLGYVFMGVGMFAFLLFLALGWFWMAMFIHILFFCAGMFSWLVWRPSKEVRDYYKELEKRNGKKEEEEKRS